MKLLDKKSFGGNMALMIDFTKAFNNIEWPFLLKVLQLFGFDGVFVGWIYEILKFAYLSLLVNGKVVGFFNYSRG